MGAQVYTFKAIYGGCENKIWRTFEISSNATLAKVGYAILSIFDTNAYHLFTIECKNVVYDTDIEYDGRNPLLSEVKIPDLKLQIGEHMKMIYDFGCEQEFDIELINIYDMPKHKGNAYPRVIDGAGRGIIDDMPAFELMKIIERTDRMGKSDFELESGAGGSYVWDYRDFDMEYDNCFIKTGVRAIQKGYEGEDW